MTPEHIFFIPIIFTLGFLSGTLVHQLRSTPGNEGQKAVQPTIALHQPRRISAKPVFFAFIIFALIFISTHIFTIPWGSKAVESSLYGRAIFDKKPSFSASAVYERLQDFPPEGIEVYKRFTYTIDVLFPLSLFIFLFLTMRFLGQRTSIPARLYKVFLILPTLWFVSDMIENLVIYILLSAFPSRNDSLASLLGFVTIIKYTLLLLSIVVPALGMTFINKVKQFNNNTPLCNNKI